MKKLLSMFTLLLLVVSCSKKIDALQLETQEEAVSFTASVEDMPGSRATLKNSWQGGEEVALFISGDDNKVYRFTVASDGTMSGEDFIVDSGSELTYIAFYPYNENLTSIYDYYAACDAGEVDYMCAKTTAKTTGDNKNVNLQFFHQMAVLSFNITINKTVTDPAISLALNGELSNAVPLVVEQKSNASETQLLANYFVKEYTDISSAYIIVKYNELETILSTNLDASNILIKGKEYPFSYTIE